MFWLHDKIALIDVMTNVLTPWNFLMTWHTFWRPDFITSWCVFTLWRTFCGHDVFMTPWPAFCCLDHFISTFQEQNIMKTNFWMSWHVFHVMTNFLTSLQTLDVMVCFWCNDEFCDDMNNFVTLLSVFFKFYDTLFDIMTYFWSNDDVFWSNDEPFTMTNFLTSWRIFDFMTNIWHIFDKFVDVIINFLIWWRLVDVNANFWK